MPEPLTVIVPIPADLAGGLTFRLGPVADMHDDFSEGYEDVSGLMIRGEDPALVLELLELLLSGARNAIAGGEEEPSRADYEAEGFVFPPAAQSDS